MYNALKLILTYFLHAPSCSYIHTYVHIVYLDKYNKVEVVPHVVLSPDVLLERDVLVVEGASLQAADETGVLDHLLLRLLLRPKIDR